jgi:hypothetical protein
MLLFLSLSDEEDQKLVKILFLFLPDEDHKLIKKKSVFI